MARRKDSPKNPPRRAYRLKIISTSLVDSDTYPTVRDVYLECAELPHYEPCLTDFQKRCVPDVVDLIRWAESLGIEVVYDPPGNMADFFTRKRDDEQSLFS